MAADNGNLYAELYKAFKSANINSKSAQLVQYETNTFWSSVKPKDIRHNKIRGSPAALYKKVETVCRFQLRC